jgi:SAM-dependent methyltransferase
VLEIGAGDGWLAHSLREQGYAVEAIDPGGDADGVRRVALAELEAPGAPFDAAVAVVSLHHVVPLGPSLDRLAELVARGGRVIVDEFDVDRLDEGAAAWWLARRERGDLTAAEVVADLREHLHPVAELRRQLARGFAVGEPVRGPYLHRWDLPAGLRGAEERAIALGELPATGARLVGVRR